MICLYVYIAWNSIKTLKTCYYYIYPRRIESRATGLAVKKLLWWEAKHFQVSTTKSGCPRCGPPWITMTENLINGLTQLAWTSTHDARVHVRPCFCWCLIWVRLRASQCFRRCWRDSARKEESVNPLAVPSDSVESKEIARREWRIIWEPKIVIQRQS